MDMGFYKKNFTILQARQTESKFHKAPKKKKRAKFVPATYVSGEYSYKWGRTTGGELPKTNTL